MVYMTSYEFRSLSLKQYACLEQAGVLLDRVEGALLHHSVEGSLFGGSWAPFKGVGAPSKGLGFLLGSYKAGLGFNLEAQ